MGSTQSKPAHAQSATVEATSEKRHNSRDQLDLKSSEPVSQDGSISLKNVAKWEDEAINDLKVRLARTILVDTDYKRALVARDARIADQHVFNLQLDFKTEPITNQKSSGRCWLFATTNVLRHTIMQKLGLKEFQLSQVSYSDSLDVSNRCSDTLASPICSSGISSTSATGISSNLFRLQTSLWMTEWLTSYRTTSFRTVVSGTWP